MRTILKHKIMSVLTVFFIGALFWTLTAGNLNPPSPPTSGTMKPLDEVEPRKSLVPGIPPFGADYLILIDQPGSYYLAQNVTSNFRHAVKITSNDVTLDLMGFRLYSSWTPPTMENQNFDGIYISPGCENIEIRNGSIVSDTDDDKKGFRHGVYAPADGAPASQRIRIFNLRVSGCRGSGIYLDSHFNTIQSCNVHHNGKAATYSVYGIMSRNGSQITANSSCDNGYQASANAYGIFTFDGSIVTDNIVNTNGRYVTGTSVAGIYTYEGCTVSGNTVHTNGYQASIYVSGIVAGEGNVVTGNKVRDNGRHAGYMVRGILASNDSTVSGNVVTSNGHYAGHSVYGMSIGSGSTVIGNSVAGNGVNAAGMKYGISLEGNSLVDQNTSVSHQYNMNDPGNCTFGTNHAP